MHNSFCLYITMHNSFPLLSEQWFILKSLVLFAWYIRNTLLKKFPSCCSSCYKSFVTFACLPMEDSMRRDWLLFVWCLNFAWMCKLLLFLPFFIQIVFSCTLTMNYLFTLVHNNAQFVSLVHNNAQFVYACT